MRGLFVAGTDTGVGKTFVSRALCLGLRRAGASVAGLKPFESGCDPHPLDARALEAAARSGLPLALRCPFQFRLPLAPAVASERRGDAQVPLIALAVRIVRKAARGRVAVVESAGGLAVPLDPFGTNLDLAVALGLPVLLVARNALGTLNHTVLSVRALRAHGLRIHGIVLSRPSPAGDLSARDNARWLERLTGVAPVVALPRTTPARAAVALWEALALERLVPKAAQPS